MSSRSWSIKGKNQSIFIGETAGSQFGTYATSSSDGNVMAFAEQGFTVGGSSVGRAFVYKYSRSTNLWTFKGGNQSIFQGEPGQSGNSGSSIALSSDGNTFVLGEYHYTYPGRAVAGRVRVFSYDSVIDAWVLKGADQSILRGENASDFAGVSVQIGDENGNTISVGEYGFNSVAGRVRVFKFDAGVWSLKGGAVTQTQFEGQGAGDQAGYYHALSIADGNTLAVGEYNYSNGGANPSIGRTRIFEYDSGTDLWNVKGVGGIVGESDSDASGVVTSSSDGNTLAIGEYGYNAGDSRGRVRVFNYDSLTDGWVPKGSNQSAFVGESPSDFAGVVVAVSYDGNIVASSEYIYDNVRGRVRIFSYNPEGDGSWALIGKNQKIFEGTNDTDYAGSSIALSGDGHVLVKGEFGYDSGAFQGRGFVYRLPYDTPPPPPPPSVTQFIVPPEERRRRFLFFFFISIVFFILIVLLTLT